MEDKIEIKKDCFAYTETALGNPECSALTELFCKECKCSFYKSKNIDRD